MKKPKRDDLTFQMDAFALTLLEEAKKAENLPDKVNTFKELGRWALIKFRLDPDGDGEEIDVLKSKLKDGLLAGKAMAARASTAFTPEQASRGGRIGQARRWGNPDPLEGDGSALDAIRARFLATMRSRNRAKLELRVLKR